MCHNTCYSLAQTNKTRLDECYDLSNQSNILISPFQADGLFLTVVFLNYNYFFRFSGGGHSQSASSVNTSQSVTSSS